MKIPTLEAEQFNLPGLSVYVVPAPLPELLPVEQTGPPNCPGQLGFEANQEVLTEQSDTARQLPLLADPPIWELPPPAVARRPPGKRRPVKKKGNQALSPGQLSMF